MKLFFTLLAQYPQRTLDHVEFEFFARLCATWEADWKRVFADPWYGTW